MKKRLFAILITLVMAMGIATVSALAIDGVTVDSVSAKVDTKSGTKATVNWTASGKGDGFKITANGPTQKTVEVKDGAAKSKEITGLTKGGNYTFTVTPLGLGEGKTSGTYFIMRPVNDLKLYPAYNSIALEWKPVNGAYDYKVFRKKQGEKKFKLVKQFKNSNKDFRAYDNKNMIAYIDKGLEDKHKRVTYTYYVLARSADKKQTSPKVSKYRTTAPVHQMFIKITFKSGAKLYTHDPKTGKKTSKSFKFKAGETVYAHSYVMGQFKFYKTINGKKYLFYANEYRFKNKKLDYSTKYGYTKKSAEYFVNTSGINSDKPYMVWTSLHTQHIYVLKGSKGKWRALKGTNNWEISSGMAATPTPAGKFRVKKKWGWHDNVKQWLVFSGGETSIHGKYSNQGYGVPHSHGCIRNPNEKIGYIYNNLARTARVFNY